MPSLHPHFIPQPWSDVAVSLIFTYFYPWSYLHSSYLFSGKARPNAVASGCIFILTSGYIFLYAYHFICLVVLITAGYFSISSHFLNPFLHLPALVGKDRPSAMGTDDEDGRTYQKASPDERLMYWKEEARFSVEYSPEPAGMLLSSEPLLNWGTSVQAAIHRNIKCWHLKRPACRLLLVRPLNWIRPRYCEPEVYNLHCKPLGGHELT